LNGAGGVFEGPIAAEGYGAGRVGRSSDLRRREACDLLNELSADVALSDIATVEKNVCAWGER